MENTAAPVRLNDLAKGLIRDNLLSEQDALSAQKEAGTAGQSFVSYLVVNNLIESQQIASIASQEFGIPLFDIDALDLNAATVNLIKPELIVQHHALPLYKRGNKLYVAVSDPSNLKALDDFQFNSRLNTALILIDEKKLSSALELIKGFAEEQLDDGFGDIDLDEINLEEDKSTLDPNTAEVDFNINDDTPIVRFINGILATAIKTKASDIHFEPYEKSYRIRIRIDGILREIKTAPSSVGIRLASRIKVLSQLNIAERRVPQDGRMRLKISAKKSIDFRVSTCPTLFGEKIVLRILDPTNAQIGINALGYEDDQKETFLKIMHQPYGMILVTGPTGSGKTVSLYTALNILNTEDRNISTAEDPAEITLLGVNQVNINPAVGFTFPDALRAFLRQDPDIIMIGEIRDLETAEIAIKAAQTGHMVLSTLHTNDAPQTITRLANMGVPSFNIASAVSLIIAQRLARRLCKNCKVPENLSVETLLAEGFTQQQIDTDFTIYKPIGCGLCTGGYRGRVGIYQVMPISETMGHIIMEDGNAMQLADQAKKEGIDDLITSGLKKVMAGLTSLEEINRVVKE